MKCFFKTILQASWTISVTTFFLSGCLGSVGGTINDDSDARAAFAKTVVPIIERDCGTSACHAAEDARYESINKSYFAFPTDAEGRITGADRLSKAYERTVERLAAEGAQFALFIRKPLDESLGGQPHRGGSQYRTMSDESLSALMNWANLAKADEPTPLSPLAQRYREEIQPILAEKRCMLSSCHGASASNLLKFDPGFIGQQNSQSSQRNYASVAMHLNFETPDPMLSRLIRKTIPQAQGGIFHRGGNDFFHPDDGDEALQTIVKFIDDARTELGDDDKGIVGGVVFAATDATPRNLFDIAAWQPGGDIYSLVPATAAGTLTNLTAAAHTGDADIRDPAVSYDGQRIAFAMRRDEQDCLNLYVMNIDGSGVTQITRDTGILANGNKVSNVEPLWGPDDRIYFTSTRAGQTSAHANVPLSNIYRIDADGSNVLRMTFNPANEVAAGWRFTPEKGKEGPEHRTLDLTFTALREVGDRLHGPLMRVPPDFHADYHPQYGTQHPEYQIFTQMTQLPDLREPLILTDNANLWEGGALAIIDRNLGPVINDGGRPSLVNYVDSLQLLGAIGDVVRHTGVSPDGYYRDPYAMPDGSIIVSYSDQAIDLTSANESPDPALYQIRLRDLEGNRIIIENRTLLVDIPGKVESDPRPIYRRRREVIEDALRYLSNESTEGELLNFDLSVSLTIAGQDSPSNKKTFDEMSEKIQYIRLVEEITAPNNARVGRGSHGMRRVLAEFPATSDRSIYVRLPAGVPFYVQALDESHAATATFNQWFWVLPGEKLNQVTRREVFDTRCGGCHGSRSGVPGDTVGTPDVLSQASRVVANYDAQTRTDIPAVSYGLDLAARVEVDFERDVQPLLTTKCATGGCHDSGGVAPDLSLRAGNAGFSGSYEVLTAQGSGSTGGFGYVDPTASSAQTSYLSEVLMQADMQAPREFNSSNCPGGERINLQELSLLMRWMDLGAAYLGIGPTTPPTLPTY